jgi:hypothetical protein
MATGADVLSMLIPQGGWIITGEEYENIQFLECEPITEKQYLDGFAQFDEWKIEHDQKRLTEKSALLERLGVTADEMKLLLG